jgi:hypothetical protein
LSGAEMEIYIYFTDPNTKYIQTAKTSAFKWDIVHSKEETEEQITCSKNTSEKDKST